MQIGFAIGIRIGFIRSVLTLNVICARGVCVFVHRDGFVYVGQTLSHVPGRLLVTVGCISRTLNTKL